MASIQSSSLVIIRYTDSSFMSILIDNEDIDWESDAGDVDNEISTSLSCEQYSINKNQVIDPLVNTQKPKRKSIRMSDSDSNESLLRHKEDLVYALQSCQKMMTDCANDVWLATLLSLSQTSSLPPTMDNLVLLMISFREVGFKMSNRRSSDDALTENNFFTVIERKICSRFQLCQLFSMYLTIAGFTNRLVFSIDPRSFHPRMHRDIVQKRLKATNNEAMQTMDMTIDLNDNKCIINHVWLEVMIEDGDDLSDIYYETRNRRWVHVDYINNVMNDPSRIQQLRGRKSLAYVIAVDKSKACYDITRDYSQNHKESTNRLKPPHIDWWFKLLAKQGVCQIFPGIQSHIGSVNPSSENDLVNNRTSSDHVPTTINEFKNHPVYTLERHLLSNQIVHPQGKIISCFRGENVYYTKDIETLRTYKQWLQHARRVNENEVPYKCIIKTVKGDKKEMKLYAKWQTSRIQVPAVQNGIIPTNTYGNVEVWGGNLTLVPEGTKLINHPNALHVARILGIYHAPALIGFDYSKSNDKTNPVFGGVIVLEECAECVSEAIESFVDHREELKEEKKRKIILQRWKKLVQSLLSMDSLHRKYVHDET